MQMDGGKPLIAWRTASPCVRRSTARADNDLLARSSTVLAHLLYASALYAARRESEDLPRGRPFAHGDVDMYEVVKALEEEHRRSRR